MEAVSILNSLDYQVLCNIGAGKFGTVILAKSDRHPDLVAIKMMDRRTSNPKFARSFLPRELAILKKVSHPHIIGVREIFEMSNGQVFIVMEAAASDLFQKLKEVQRFPVDQAKALFTQLLSAVGYLHQNNISHRDLKCENVLLSADGQVKLADFGLSGFSKGFPFLSMRFCCTRYYAAPEVVMNWPYDPKKADVWSLGVIFYTMVTGFYPFKKMDHSTLEKLQSTPMVFPLNCTVDRACRNFILYMLQFNPFFRPSVKQVEQHTYLRLKLDKELVEDKQQEYTVEADKKGDDFQWNGLLVSSGLLSSVINFWEIADPASSPQGRNMVQQEEKDSCEHLPEPADLKNSAGESQEKKDSDRLSCKLTRWLSVHIPAPIRRTSKAFQNKLRRITKV